MAQVLTHVRVTNVPGLIVLLVLWIVLFQCTHLLVMLLRREPVVGWAIGPLGVSIVFLHEPSTIFIWLEVVCPALVSGGTLYFGLSTRLSPVVLPAHHALVEIAVIVVGVLLTSTKDVMNALRDLRHPLWGEARLLRKIQKLRASCARIHFTPFGYSYLHDHFRSSPADLLQAL
jgi:uncharacterized membrane protein YdcZ (DUF606 family)